MMIFLNFPEINSKNQKYQLLHILQVSRLETWLTVYRALDILEQFGGSKGRSGQRLSVFMQRKRL